jgi:putative sterol carrier protein
VAGAPDAADAVITTDDDVLHRLLTRRLDPAEAVETGAVTIEGPKSELAHLLDLFSFPAIDSTERPHSAGPAREPLNSV